MGKIILTSTFKPSYVAFLDILGFKEFVKSHGFKQIKEIFDRITIDEKTAPIAMTRATNDDDGVLTRYNRAIRQCRIRIMSDSIVIAAPSKFKESLAVVLDACNDIQEALYECTEPIFLRGAVAEGDFYISNDVMFGQGLVDAYLAQENISIYPRIIVSEDVLRSGIPSVDDLGASGYGGFSKDSDGYYYINTMGNWLLLANCGRQINWTEKYDKLKSYIHKVLSGYPDNRLRKKYLWLQAELERTVKSAEAAREVYGQATQVLELTEESSTQ